MSAESQFWWNWWVSVGVAIATLAAALVALFGDWIKSRLFSPKLKLSLRNDVGDRTTVTTQWETEQGLQQRNAEARYYHVKVENKTRWPHANRTQVYLVRVEEPGPGGDLQITWSGELPLQWTHQAIHPVARTIGPSAYCDLCSVVKGQGVQLHPLIVPNNFPVIKRSKVTLFVSLQAKGIEGESPIARFRIAWDGNWEDGETEMKRHLSVKEVTEKA
jgi:hypothetical protein